MTTTTTATTTTTTTTTTAKALKALVLVAVARAKSLAAWSDFKKAGSALDLARQARQAADHAHWVYGSARSWAAYVSADQAAEAAEAEAETKWYADFRARGDVHRAESLALKAYEAVEEGGQAALQAAAQAMGLGGTLLPPPVDHTAWKAQRAIRAAARDVVQQGVVVQQAVKALKSLIRLAAASAEVPKAKARLAMAEASRAAAAEAEATAWAVALPLLEARTAAWKAAYAAGVWPVGSTEYDAAAEAEAEAVAAYNAACALRAESDDAYWAAYWAVGAAEGAEYMAAREVEESMRALDYAGRETARRAVIRAASALGLPAPSCAYDEARMAIRDVARDLVRAPGGAGAAARRAYRARRAEVLRDSQARVLEDVRAGEWVYYEPGQQGGTLSSYGIRCTMPGVGSARGISRDLGVAHPEAESGDWTIGRAGGCGYWVRLSVFDRGRWAPRRSRRDPVAFDMAAE